MMTLSSFCHAETLGASAVPKAPEWYKEPIEGETASVRFIANSNYTVKVKNLDVTCDFNTTTTGRALFGKDSLAGFISSLDSSIGYNKGYKGKRLKMPLGDETTVGKSSEVKFPANKDILIIMQDLESPYFVPLPIIDVVSTAINNTAFVCPLYIKTALKKDHFYEFVYDQKDTQTCSIKASEIVAQKDGGYVRTPLDVLISKTCPQGNSQQIKNSDFPTNVISKSEIAEATSTMVKEDANKPVEFVRSISPDEVWQSKISGVPVYEKPDGITVILKLNKSEEVVLLGEMQTDYAKIQSANGKGWVNKSLIKKSQ